MQTVSLTLDYLSIEELIDFINEPNRTICHAILADNREPRFPMRRPYFPWGFLCAPPNRTWNMRERQVLIPCFSIGQMRIVFHLNSPSGCVQKPGSTNIKHRPVSYEIAMHRIATGINPEANSVAAITQTVSRRRIAIDILFRRIGSVFDTRVFKSTAVKIKLVPVPSAIAIGMLNAPERYRTWQRND